MTWPDWGDVFPTLALLVGMAGSVAGAFWALLRMFQPVAERAARDAVDSLYARLKANDFKHVEDGLRAIGDRLDCMREEVGGRLDRADKRLEGGLERLRVDFGGRSEEADKRLEDGLGRLRVDFGGRLEEADKRREDGLERLRVEFGGRLEEVDRRLGGRLDRADKRLQDGLDRARTDRQEMEARLLAAIRELSGPEQVLEA